MSFAKLWSKTPVLMDFTDNSNAGRASHAASLAKITVTKQLANAMTQMGVVGTLNRV